MKADSIRYQKALNRVNRIKGFYSNLIVYCLVMPVLGFVNYQTTGFPWAVIPAVAWGFGLLMNGFDAFGYNPFYGRNWETRKIEEFMAADSD
jgi:hypothetical protein